MKTLLIAVALGASMLTATAASAGTPQTPATTTQKPVAKKAEPKTVHAAPAHKAENLKESKAHAPAKAKAREMHKTDVKATPKKETEKKEMKKAEPAK